MTEREKRDKIIENLEWAIGDEDVYDCLYVDDLEGVMDTMKDALTLIKALDVTPEELERLKLCRHECKVDCLLESFNRVVEERDTLLKDREPRVVKISELTSGEPMLVWLEDIDKDETVAGMIFDYVPGRFGFKLTNIGSMDRIYPLIEEYLTRWRCWTSRPTDEQREAVKWE